MKTCPGGLIRSLSTSTLFPTSGVPDFRVGIIPFLKGTKGNLLKRVPRFTKILIDPSCYCFRGIDHLDCTPRSLWSCL